MAMEVYYHYTDKTGYDNILKSGFIKKSSKLDAADDALFGDGVYFTNLPPSKGKKAIAIVCWENLEAVELGRVDYVFEVHVPRGVMEKSKERNGVFLYSKGNYPLNENGWAWKAYKV